VHSNKKSMNEETKELHRANGSFDLVPIILIHPDNRVTFRHNYFPNDLFCDIGGVKKPILRNSRSIIRLLKFDKLASTHPQIVNMPTLKNVSKILSEKQTLEPSLAIHHIYPQTAVNVSHCLKCLPQRF
jgi:hypothetical protein